MHKEEWRYWQAGTDLLLLAEDYARWVPRREERVELVDHELIKRTVRLDIDLSKFKNGDVLDLELVDGRVPIPLATIDRRQHTTFDIVNEEGSALPRLTADEERFIVYAGVANIVKDFLEGRQQELHESTKRYIFSLVHDRPGPPKNIDSSQIALLLDDPKLKTVFESVRRLYYLSTFLDPERGLRRVIFYRWLEPLRPRDHLDGIYLQSTVPQDTSTGRRQSGKLKFGVDVGTAGDCRSYHFELLAPHSLQVVGAKLLLAYPDAPEPLVEKTDDDRLSAHAHVHAATVPRRTVGRFTASMQLLPHGLIRVAFVGATLNLAAILFAGAIEWFGASVWLLKGSVEPGSGTELFLLVPAVIGPLVAKAGTSSPAEPLQLPFKSMLWASSVAAYIAAGAIATGIEGPLRAAMWFLAVVIALATTINAYRSRNRLKRDAELPDLSVQRIESLDTADTVAESGRSAPRDRTPT